MAKSKGGKSKGNVSAGIHSTVDKATKKALRRQYLESPQRVINQRKAFDAGKNVMITIPNPNPNETNKRFVRVNAREVWRSNKWQPK